MMDDGWWVMVGGGWWMMDHGWWVMVGGAVGWSGGELGSPVFWGAS